MVLSMLILSMFLAVLVLFDRDSLRGGIFHTSGWRGRWLFRLPTRRILPPDRDPPLDCNTSLQRDPRQSGLGRVGLGRGLESGLESGRRRMERVSAGDFLLAGS